MNMAIVDDNRPASERARQGSNSLGFFGNGGVGFDETLGADGMPRAHWAKLFETFEKLGAEECAQRHERLDRQIRQTGIAHDAFSDPDPDHPKWRLDLTPVIISEDEWAWLARAVAQRAKVLNAFVADIYGACDLIADGSVPAELIYSDQAYLRACQGALPHDRALMFYACDVARGPDGTWRVIDNHTETLAGIGFALANRIAHTHVAGDIFNACNARRLAPFFQSLRKVLRDQAGRDDATIALLSPGPHHSDYFSHAFLARYLGVLLVEGADLRCAGERVYLKTLEGLKPIDLVLRCTEGRLSDPLELDPSGFQGPPGLVDSMRRNPNLLANPIGSAIAQNRGLGPFMSALAERIVDEPLMLHDAPRWWLGQPDVRDHVRSHLHQFVIRSCQEQTGRPGLAELGRDSRTLSEADREALFKDIELHGDRLVAEVPTGFSTAPAFGEEGLSAVPFGIRLFAHNTGDDFEVMPGGLAMDVGNTQTVGLSAPDGRTRDVWALSSVPQARFKSLWKPSIETARIARSHRVTQSRVADSLFWLGRFTERADWTMRTMRSGLRRVEEDGSPSDGRRAARACLNVLLGANGTSALPAEIDSDHALANEIEALSAKLIRESASHRALMQTLSGLYRNASITRDRLSHEAWQTLSQFQPGGTWSKAMLSATPLQLLDEIEHGLAGIAAFNGLMHENMTRNYGWSFLDMGRRLERAYNLCEVMQALFVPAPLEDEESGRLLLLLELADSFITYRSRYRIDPMLPLVLDLLLLDETNPRSLAYQLVAISDHLENLPDGMRGVSRSEDRRMALGLLTGVRLTDIESAHADPKRVALGALLAEQTDSLPELTNAIARHYFNLADAKPHRAARRGL
jgi:uncharacterized circularly permuted ATP-grasp superfamily protein/uncharacterized alpha-E superfamily protein